MKKISISSILSQLLLLFFVIIWIIPTFGLFISSLRDKDLLAISGWWTSLTTTEINEIYRMSGMEAQIEEDGYFIIKDKIFEEGALILGSGHRSIRFRPHLNIKKSEIDIAVDIIRKALLKLKT